MYSLSLLLYICIYIFTDFLSLYKLLLLLCVHIKKGRPHSPKLNSSTVRWPIYAQLYIQMTPWDNFYICVENSHYILSYFFFTCYFVKDAFVEFLYDALQEELSVYITFVRKGKAIFIWMKKVCQSNPPETSRVA